MVAQVSKPGVNVRQVFEGTPAVSVAPQLAPCIVGPLFEVVDLLDDTGAPASASKVVTGAGDLRYAQIPVDVPATELPTPHADPNQMSLIGSSVTALLAQRDVASPLSRTSSFLTEMNLGHRAGVFIPVTSNLVTETYINIAIDSLIADSVVSDVHVQITANSTAATIAAAINTAIGKNVASAETLEINNNAVEGLLIQSTRAGAAGSVTLRKSSGGFTSTFISDMTAGQFDESIRVEGAGLYAEESALPGIATSPFVAHSQGKILTGAPLIVAELASVTAKGVQPTQRNPQGALTLGETGAIDFSTFSISAATALKDGDILTATGPYGQSISRVMITGVQAKRLRLGVVDTLRSEYDADGNPTMQRYIDFALTPLSGATPFAPRNGYIIAQSLSGSETNEAGYAESQDIALLQGFTASTAATVAFNVNQDFVGAVGTVATVTLSVDGAVTSGSYTIKTGDDIDALSIGIEAALGGIKTTVANDLLTVESLVKSANVTLSLTGDAWAALGTFVNGSSDTGSDAELEDITGKLLRVTLDSSAIGYVVVISSDSLAALVTDTNGVLGYAALSLVETGNTVKLKLVSPLMGVGSSVSVSSSGDDDFGKIVTFAPTQGTGRPLPDLRVSVGGTTTVGAQVLRSSMTGRPLNSSAALHIAYRALRLDVTPVANEAGILRVSNFSDLEAIYGPVDARNPLALGIYFAMINAGAGVEVNAIGVDDVSDAAPTGTPQSYARALEFLRGFEVYSVVPLSASEDVIQLVNAHVNDMSEPTMRGERVAITSPSNPTRRNDTVLLSSGAAGGDSTGNLNQVDLNDSPEALLAAAGIDTSDVIPVTLDNGQQLFLTLTLGDTLHRRSVKSVDGARVTLRAASELTTAENGDGFFTSDDLPDQFSGAVFALELRGTVLTLPGSDRLDRTAYAETIRDKAQQYMNRRQLRLYPDTVQSSAIGGVSARYPSFYWAAALAGAAANLPAQEPFTRVPLVGFSDVIGPRLDRGHYDTISAGNSVIEVESPGMLPALRLQSTTDPSTIESREWSITRVVDLFAKMLRNQLKARIGRFNITQSYLDELTLMVDGLCSTAVAVGMFRSVNLAKLEQDQLQPDNVVVVVRVEVLFPANYIDVTIVV